jgi:RNA 3'-terminal phosphate cyclase (ATP)
MIEIDGSLLEGGGQVLRTSVALSALTGIPVKVTRIRANRDNPGLQAQHLAAVEALAKLVNAEVTGLKRESSTIEFHPGQIKGGLFKIDVGTAGSISLVLQALVPVACFAPSEVSLELMGGTDVPWSPTIDYLRLVFMPTIGKMGCRISSQLVRRGHYPKGGGLVKVNIDPVEDTLKPLRLDQFGEVKSIMGVSHAARLPSHVAARQADAAKKKLEESGYKSVEIDIWYKEGEVNHLGPGSGIALCATTTTNALIGADSLGERGKPAEEVGSQAATKLIDQLDRKCATDVNLSDMIIPYIAIADGNSIIMTSDITLHTRTNVAITENILKTKININEKNGHKAVTCAGIGLRKTR